MRLEWPLCGRDDECRRFGRLLANEETAAVVVAGAAGVGKTFFAAHCLRMAARTGFTTAQVTATQAAGVLPFGALAHLLPAGTHDRRGDADSDPHLLHRLAHGITDRAGPRGLVLLIDDAHLLDNASAALVHHLVATRAAFVLLTARTATPAPDAITALWKDRLAERLELHGLDDDVVQDLLLEVLGGPVDPAAVTELCARSQGNLLFLRELVFGAVEARILREDRGIWRLTGPLTPSDRLAELIQIRLEALDVEERSLLEVVAFGEPLGPAEISSFAANDLVERLERQRLLRINQDGRRLEFRLAHPLYGDVLRASTPTFRARSIARSLAEAVERTGARRREDALRIASWRLDSGEGSAELLLAAAVRSRWRYDFPRAEQLARAAVESGAGFEAALLAAEVASLQGRGDEAEAELAVLAARAENDSERMRVATFRVYNQAIYQGRLIDGLRIAEEAESTIVDPAARDGIRARRSTMVLGVDGPRAAAKVVEPLLNRASGGALVWACRIGAHSLARLGQIDRALELATRGYSTQLDLVEPPEWFQPTHLFFRCEALTYAGRFIEAEELAREQHQRALLDHSQEGQAFFAWQLSTVAVHRGQMSTAVAHGREAVALFSALGRRPFEQAASIPLAIASAALGRPAEAAEALRSAEFHDSARWYPVDLLEAQAWTAAARNDLLEAKRLLDSASELARSTGDRVGEAAALSAAARLGYAKEVHPRLSNVAACVEGDLAINNALRATLVARGDAAGLERLSHTFEAMGALLLAAECAAEAATAWRRGGRERAAHATEQRAGVLAENCGKVSTPALATTGSRDRLTPTELRIALLAQGGRSNKAIAEELFVSVRTVGNHLHRAYQKLGISGREELRLNEPPHPE